MLQGHTLSFLWAMSLGVTQRREEAHVAPSDSQVREGHKSDHMLLRHVSGCKQD